MAGCHSTEYMWLNKSLSSSGSGWSPEYPISSGSTSLSLPSSSSSECSHAVADGVVEEAAVTFDGGAGVFECWGMGDLAGAGVTEDGAGADALPGGG